MTGILKNHKNKKKKRKSRSLRKCSRWRSLWSIGSLKSSRRFLELSQTTSRTPETLEIYQNRIRKLPDKEGTGGGRGGGGSAVEEIYYFDADGDGFGFGSPVSLCNALDLTGWVSNSDDLDDNCYSNVHDCFGLCDGSAEIDGSGG